MKKIILAALGSVAMFGAVAFAQSVSVSTQSSVGSTDLINIIPGGTPSARSSFVYPKQITSQSGYQKASPATGFTYTFGNSDSFLVLTHSTTLATGTVVLASAPSDGAQECIYAQNAVTTLTLSKASTQTLNNAVTTIAALGKVCYLYSASNLTWDRSQ